jgi:MoaA/NifB/PqqE/SkfB family radical SAM enzyme
MLELTDRCNLKCMICLREEYEANIGGPGTLMQLEDVLKLERPIRNAEIITVTGFGETFLHPQLKLILDRIYLINPSDNLIKIVTNGTALGADKVEWFAGHLNTLSISLNAADAGAYAREMHPYEVGAGKDMTSRFGRLVDKILTFANRLSPEDRRKIHLHYVVHRGNMHDMSKFVHLCHSLRLSEVQFTHFKVHREKNISDSIYWAKDEYNDAFDEAAEVGRQLGITVGGRKFFTEQQREFVPERDCTWPHDSSIVTVKGNIVPCCYWSGDDRPGNAFTSNESFDEIWFGSFYEGLRKKRNAKPCHTCNILHTFDNVLTHFSPFLKSNESFKEQFARLREVSANDIAALTNKFDQAGLDMSLHRWVLRSTTGDVERLLDLDILTPRPFAAVNAEISAWFATQTWANTEVVDLAGRFIGTGWGTVERNVHGQAWRWAGRHHGEAALWLQFDPGRDGACRVHIHTATEGALNTVRIRADGQDLKHQGVSWHEDGTVSLWAIIPREHLQQRSGRVMLTITIEQPGADWIAFSRVSCNLENLSGFQQRRGLDVSISRDPFNVNSPEVYRVLPDVFESSQLSRTAKHFGRNLFSLLRSFARRIPFARRLVHAFRSLRAA